MPPECSFRSWCRLRTIVNLSATRASFGSSSVISMPGTLVRIGWNGPRYSAGASGFRSNRSRWLGPPLAQNRMTENSLSTGGDCSAAKRPASDGCTPSDSAPKLRLPSFSHVRRSIGPWQLCRLALDCTARSFQADATGLDGMSLLPQLCAMRRQNALAPAGAKGRNYIGFTACRALHSVEY